jgi:hypothetical protein
MRSVQLHVRRPIPSKKIEWLRTIDQFRALWAATHRKPFSGRISVGYYWKDRRPVPVKREASIAVELISRLGFMLEEGARPFIGAARCEVIEKYSSVTLTVEEAQA